MKDPKEKDAFNGQENDPQKVGDGTAAEDHGNWDEHQRIDEEGNELKPDDVK